MTEKYAIDNGQLYLYLFLGKIIICKKYIANNLKVDNGSIEQGSHIGKSIFVCS